MAPPMPSSVCTFAHHHADDFATGGAEGEADANLVPALGHGKRDHPG
jgi:hypothetical protein